ncbi:MAG: hypothetical protein AAB522_01545 [Patescibacteria group bacterium]
MRGYSLIEVLIYSTILALIAALSAASIISSWRGFQKSRIDGELARNGEFALERITRDIRLSDNIGASSSFTLSPGILELIWGATSTKYSLSGQVLQRKEGGGVEESITSGDTRIMNLIFWNEATSSPSVSSRIIKIEFTLEAGEGALLKQKNFFGSAVLRGQY